MEASHGTVTRLLIISPLIFTLSSKSSQTSNQPSFDYLIVPSLISNLNPFARTKFSNSFFCWADLWMTRKDLCLVTMESCSDMLDEECPKKKVN